MVVVNVKTLKNLVLVGNSLDLDGDDLHAEVHVEHEGRKVRQQTDVFTSVEGFWYF